MEHPFDLEPRPDDVFVAVMGMTGAGKSTFISLCTGDEVAVGHDLQACTQQVAVYKCKWTSTCDIYLLDTPGFDDTNRSDTEVLREIAAWLTQSYRLNLKLSGIIYLHRITDPRMQGSAKKNLFMLKKLCGSEGLKNAMLVSTMWELVDENVGSNREEELVATEEFWGLLVRGGASVKRHDNNRDSAMRLLKEIVKNKKMAMSIQKEMVTDGKSLDQTQAGMEVESELRRQRDRFKKDLEEVREMMREALEARDRESANALQEHKAETERKIERIKEEREKLKVTLEAMHADRFAEFEKEQKQQREELRRLDSRHKEELQRQEERYKEMNRRSLREQKSKSSLEVISPKLENGQEAKNARLRMQSLLKELSNQQPEDNGRESVDTVAQELDRRLGLRSKLERMGSPQLSTDTSFPSHQRTCMTLSGNWYYFMGPRQDFYFMPSEFYAKGWRGRQMYVACGTKNSWYLHSHDIGGRCRTRYSHNLRVEYPSLYSWLPNAGGRKEGIPCPSHLSLGPDGMYYMKLRDGGELWAGLPKNIIEEIRGPVLRVWLGSGGAHVIEKEPGQLIWNLMGRYGELSDILDKYKARGIEDLAMDIVNPLAYAMVMKDGTSSYGVGESQLKFSELQFKEYTKSNFNFKSD